MLFGGTARYCQKLSMFPYIVAFHDIQIIKLDISRTIINYHDLVLGNKDKA